MSKQARLEDLHFMAATGASLEEAAHRLGLTIPALERWMYKNRLNQLRAQMKARTTDCTSRRPVLV